jgi:TusA-related sulfurtransferase
VTAPPQPPITSRLDLRGTPCPVNFIRARLTLEGLVPGQWLELDLDPGEPEQAVHDGLLEAGHRVQRGDHPQAPAAVRLLVQRHAG